MKSSPLKVDREVPSAPVQRGAADGGEVDADEEGADANRQWLKLSPQPP
jgi:hypothetical protein